MVTSLFSSRRKESAEKVQVNLEESCSSIVQATLATDSAAGAGSEAVASLLKVAGVSASGEWLACWCRCCCGDAPDSEICFSINYKLVSKLSSTNLGKMGRH
jgi:hypothetical protein